MCGVAAIYAYRGGSVDRDELGAIRDYMALRGPDGKGEWFSKDGRIGLGHRRLSIIDLSERASQPMVSADGRFAISFNGEIYNYKALRSELEANDYVFQSQSDTEVLLHLYADRGESMLSSLRGMFAFALYDSVKDTLLLARDPYGIKPLYFSNIGGTIRVASQVKALLTSNSVSQTPDPAGLAGFYMFGSVPEPFTIYDSVRAIPAGSFIKVSDTGLHEAKRYFSIAEIFCHAEAKNDAGVDEQVIKDALLDSVKHHLVSDVSVGAFLSSGVDSGSMVGLMKDAGGTYK